MGDQIRNILKESRLKMVFYKTTFNILYICATSCVPIPNILIGHTAVLTVYLAYNEGRHVFEGPVDGIVNQFVSMFVDVNIWSYFSTGILY
jgi:hypothetical protein